MRMLSGVSKDTEQAVVCRLLIHGDGCVAAQGRQELRCWESGFHLVDYLFNFGLVQVDSRVVLQQGC